MSPSPFRNVFRSIDPRTEECFGERPCWHADECQRAIHSAAEAAATWANSDSADRRRALLALADGIEQASEQLAGSVCRETGKLRSEADDEVFRSAKWCRFLAERASLWLADEHNAVGTVLRKPMGVVLVVAPWNFPVWQIVRPAAAALAAGNAALIKPAGNVAQTSSLLELIGRDVLPDGLLQCVWLDELGTRTALSDPRINMLVCTGSETTGRQLGAIAAHHLKPSILELGGNNPLIVLDDADIGTAAQAAAQSRCINAGQTCTAAKRFIVQESVAEQFISALGDAMSAYRCGENLAPLARTDLRNRLEQQVNMSIGLGARVIMGGEAYSTRGSYYPATLLSQAAPGMPVYDDELFGPVGVICTSRDDSEAVHLANAVRQGLVASIWSGRRERAQDMAYRLRAGMVCFNNRPTSRFEFPFAGAGASGYGSVLGRDGLLAFTRPAAWLG